MKITNLIYTSLALSAVVIMTACTTVTVPSNDTTVPDVTLKQIANPASRTIGRLGTPGSGRLREDVSGRDTLALLGHAEDSDGGVKSASVNGEVTTKCQSIVGTRDLSLAPNSGISLSANESRSPNSSGQASTILNVVLQIPLEDTVGQVRSRCKPVFRLINTEWVVGTFSARASNFSNGTAVTDTYQFIWKPCPNTESHSNDLIATFKNTQKLRLHTNNAWQTIPLSRVLGIGRPSWSPCKDRVVFRAVETNSSGAAVNPGSKDLFIVSRDGTKLQLTDAQTCTNLHEMAELTGLSDNCVFSDPDWSPSGEIASAVQFFSNQGTPSSPFLVIIDPDGPDFRLIKQSHNGVTAGVWDPKWSPYGDRIIFRTVTAPDIPLAQGIFVTTPGFQSLCKIEIGGAEVWMPDGNPGEQTQVAYATSDGIHVAVFSAPSSNTGCPGLVNDSLLPDSDPSDFAVNDDFTGGSIAFVRKSGNNRDIFVEHQGSVQQQLSINKDVVGFDY